jgi:hypothetical protein
LLRANKGTGLAESLNDQQGHIILGLSSGEKILEPGEHGRPHSLGTATSRVMERMVESFAAEQLPFGILRRGHALAVTARFGDGSASLALLTRSWG